MHEGKTFDMSSANFEPAEVILESGFSLSEKAHGAESHSFCDVAKDPRNLGGDTNGNMVSSLEELRQMVLNDIVGVESTVVKSPFEVSPGEPAVLPLVYCDFTASHRPLKSIESYLSKHCLPSYGNTHTNTSLTGSQSTAFCAEARQIVGEVCGAKITGKTSEDIVLFAGNGTTSAVELLIDCLGLKHHILQISSTEKPDQVRDKPVIFAGPFEHHSNLLPWRELGHADIETVKLDQISGNIDVEHLKELLEQYKDRKIKIGAFSVASNVTGVIANDIQITALLHEYGALSIWDYATGASYLDVEMNPRHADYGHAPNVIAKDAILLSGHKMLGGVGTPGVLIIKKHLVSQQNAPNRSGGGTVFYVTADHHRFLSNRIERFEGGTPNIVGIWRLGLAMSNKLRLKKQVQTLHGLSLLGHDLQRSRRLQRQLEAISNLVLMDSAFEEASSNKLPIFSFLVKCGTRFLHYNYVCTLLNDLFGIQSRGGCQCAGPFAQYLLGLDHQTNKEVEDCLVHTKDELLRPGFTRLSLPTFGTTQKIEDYVVRAIAWVAKNGWKLLHVYRCNHRTGDWRHKSRPGAPLGKRERKWLSHYRAIWESEKSGSNFDACSLPPELSDAFETANSLLALAIRDQSSLVQTIKMSQDSDQDSSSLASLRWYVYPKEVATFLKQGFDEVPDTMDRRVLTGALRPVAWYKNRAILKSKVQSQTKNGYKVDEDIISMISLDVLEFRDGSHTGSASLVELRQGFDDGEISKQCQVYQPRSNSWESITNVLSAEIDNTREAKLSTGLITDQNHVLSESGNTKTNSSVFFRDGDHSGEAPIEEVVNAFEEGELTLACEIYDGTLGEWKSIREATRVAETPLERIQGNSHVGPKSHGTKILDIPFVEKSAAKKPQRDSLAWGQGQLVTLKQQSAIKVDHFVETRSKRQKHITPPPKLMRHIIQAIVQWGMIEEGDRLLLGLSGGKDSLSLLHALLELKKKLPINFEIEVCTIDPMTPSFDPSPLIPYVATLGLKYHYIKDDIVERANSAGRDGKVVSSLCSYCARMKRGNLYSCARRNNCNKLVLAQHLDDLAESFMMSVMHNGFLRTMKANYKINAGDLAVIRPLVYCRESLTADFAKKHLQGLVVNENCPACFEEPKERARIKKLLSKEETLYPNFYDNIKRSLLPLMHDDATAILRSYTEEALAKSRRGNRGERGKDNIGDCRVHTDEGTTYEEKKEPGRNDYDTGSPQGALAAFTEDQLVKELARRRAERYRLAGAMKRLGDSEASDPTGQICSFNGGSGTIPCRELME